MAGPIHAVDQQDVQPAVGVVIEERAARPQCFGQKLGAVRAAVVPELDAGRGRDVLQPKAGGAGARGERPRRPSEMSAGSRDAHQPVANRVDHQLGGIVDAERLHDIGAMDGDGVRAEAQQDRDVLVRFAVDDELQHFQFARWSARARRSPSAGSARRGSRTLSPAATCLTASTSSRSIAFFSR